MSSKMIFRAALLVVFSSQALSQITLTGCHLDNGQEVCLLPGGMETTVATATGSLMTSLTGTTTINSPTPTAPTSVTASTTATAQTTAITGCHMHGVTQYCVKGDGAEVQVLATATGTAALPTSYNSCHAHGTEMFCMTTDGEEVEVVVEGTTESESTSESTEETTGQNCHFHAGVEHCVASGESESESEGSCERKNRDYKIKLRGGLIVVMLAASLIAVYSPLALTKLLKRDTSGSLFVFIQQFGTGVIIATALVHLLTHAELMFANSCLGELKYESTATSITMAAAFIAFIVDYAAHRLAHWRLTRRASRDAENQSPTSSVAEKANNSEEIIPVTPPLAAAGHNHGELNLKLSANDLTTVVVLESGIIFHSLLIGITVVVAGDSVFVPLFIVIIFHQMFEGLALGTRIASIDTTHASRASKIKLYIAMPLAFALVTPIGMAIGIGVLKQFNGNSPSTIIALGTLDSASAGILLWVGFVDMWARDWIFGQLRHASWFKTMWGALGLVGGMALMSFLGKWA